MSCRIFLQARLFDGDGQCDFDETAAPASVAMPSMPAATPGLSHATVGSATTSWICVLPRLISTKFAKATLIATLASSATPLEHVYL